MLHDRYLTPVPCGIPRSAALASRLRNSSVPVMSSGCEPWAKVFRYMDDISPRAGAQQQPAGSGLAREGWLWFWFDPSARTPLMTQTALERARHYQDELVAIRRDIHAHPELGLEEYRTADLVARKLEEWGIEVHRGIGKTGVVGVLRNGNGQDAVGLRADMDALPILEATGLPHASSRPGLMHACGHDGHTATLLGAAKYLAETRNFNGTVNFIFQPAEEGLGGAEEMLKDGLFDRFPCNYVYGMHNRPGLPVGKFITGKGVRMAGGAFFDIHITGKGAHGARPQESVDPVLVACHLG